MLPQWAADADAKGITWVNASGDSGAAGCDPHDVTAGVAEDGFAVNGFAAIPDVTGVGGTEFAELSGGGPYWNAANGPGFASAVSYIPETAWNDTKIAGYLAATGGGSSTIFSKPA